MIKAARKMQVCNRAIYYLSLIKYNAWILLVLFLLLPLPVVLQLLNKKQIKSYCLARRKEPE